MKGVESSLVLNVIVFIAGVEPPRLTFSVDMTNDDFLTFMKTKGLQDKDASILTGKLCCGFMASIFHLAIR